MFADLDRIDIVYADGTGRRVGVQTDHRTPAEIATDEPRSIVFALARLIGPVASEEALGTIEYAFEHPPPARLREAIEAAGSVLRVGAERLAPLQEPNPDHVDALAAEALEALALDVVRRYGIEPNEDGLKSLERDLAEGRSGFEGWSPERRHTAVLELGAAAGLVIRRVAGAEWVRDPYFGNAIPFTVDASGHRCNIFGRAERFFAESPLEGPSVLIGSLQDGEHQDGIIVPVLRPEDFSEHDRLKGRPLVAVDPQPAGVPRVLLVQDRPHTVAYLTHESVEDFDVLLEASLENLAKIPVSAKRLEGDLPLFVLDGSFYAASKILDRLLLAGLSEALESEVLMLGVPARDVALVAPLVDDTGLVAGFTELVKTAFQEQTESHRLSELVFVATADEGVQGVLHVKEREASSGTWWKKLLD